MENKYQKGKIYKIVDNGYNMVYYGSTIGRLSKRMGKHREDYRKKLIGGCKVQEIFKEYGVENCKIELVENYPCNSKEELQKREGYYIANNECVNKRIEGRTKKEYYEDNKEHFQDYKNKWYNENKDRLDKKNKQYYKDHKEEIQEYKKKHYEEKKEHYKAYKKEWYERKKAEKQINI